MKKNFLLTSLLPFSLAAVPPSSTWNNTTNTNDNWSVASNWSPQTVPNAQDQLIVIGTPPPTTASITITQDVSPTVVAGTITFINNTAGNNYGFTISGTNSLTMSASAAEGGTAFITTNASNTAAFAISAPIVLASNLGIMHLDTSHTLPLSGIISGSFSVTKDGGGTVILSGANTFSNGLIIEEGILQCGAPTTLPASSSITLTGGILDLNNNAQTIGGLSGTFPINLGSAILTVNTTAPNSYGGVISQSGGLSVGGTGSLTLTNSSTYLGETTVTGGTLQLGVSNALPVGGAVTITGGTLDLNNFNQSVGTLSGTGGSITLGSGQLSISLAKSQNFSSVISGSGSVDLNGNGFIWSLGAAQTYAGLTTINNGTVQLGIANGLPSGSPVTLLGGGILNLNSFSQNVGTFTSSVGTQVQLGSGSLRVTPTSSANFAGVISGTGSVTLQGTGSWTFQTAQTYTGGTFITSGTLQLATPNALASTGTVNLNNLGSLLLNNNPLAIGPLNGSGLVNLGSGTLTINTSNISTPASFSGGIVGTGGLVVQGNGTQILTGSNTYSGGTTISGSATLQGTTNSLQGTIFNNSTLFFNQSFKGTYGGPLSGTGLLQIGGQGIITLKGTPTQGSVALMSGGLDVGAGSTLTASSISVSNGAMLGGTGTYAANIFNSGTINPADTTTLGILTVNGNVTFEPGSSFIADLTSTASDQLQVKGLVTIQPNSEIIIDAERGEYEEETRYAIITSTQPVVGTFQSFKQTNPFLEVNLLYNQLLPGSVEVDLQIRNLSDVIQGGNAGAISKCITQTNMKSDHDLELLIADLIFLDIDQVRKALEEMQPSQLRTLTVAEQTSTLFAQEILNGRMAAFDRSICEKELTRCFSSNFWVSLAGNWTDQSSTAQTMGYKAPAVGLMAGFDGKISNNLFLGLAIEYGHVALDWKENRGSAKINRMSAGPYLSYVGQFGYLNASLLTSFATFDTKRNLPFFKRTAISSHRGENLLTHLEGGLVFHPASQVFLTPFVMLDLLYGWEDSFQEAGAKSLNFQVASAPSALFRSELGVKISKCAVRSHTKWVHDIKASWVREERYRGKQLTATFRQFPCSFIVQGFYPSRNFLDVGMGLTFIFKKDKLAASLRYEGQFGENVNIQSGIAQLLTRF